MKVFKSLAVAIFIIIKWQCVKLLQEHYIQQVIGNMEYCKKVMLL